MGYYDGTKNENRGLRREDGRLAGSVKLPRIAPPPGTLKACTACGDSKPIEDFGKRLKSPDLHDYYCKACRADRAMKLYRGRKKAQSVNRWKRLKGDTLRVFLDELLSAAREARSAGLWRGRDAIRAYKRLGDALDLFFRDGAYEKSAMVRDAPPCTCPAWPCPRHAEEVTDPEDDFVPANEAGEDERRTAQGE